MTSLIFPDINVWLALTLSKHEHSAIAWKWYRSLQATENLAFCRITQLGFLRLLTTAAVAGRETVSQHDAWSIYSYWLEKGDVQFMNEPFGIEIEFRALADRSTPSPKEWADSYLAAFTRAGSSTLVTFNRALSKRAGRAILLEP